jgi:RNA polymerase sigma-70 factor, ECF subfamily
MGESKSKKVGHDVSKLCFQEKLDDDALMRAVCACEVSALEAIYNRYSKLLFPICQRIVKDKTAAEEVLQDIFLEIWRIPGRFNPVRGSLIVYLMHLTRSRAIDRWRKERKMRREYPTDSDISPLIAAMSQKGKEPPHMVELYEQIAHMKSALGQLPALQRTPIELAFLDGLSHAEIAKVLSIPLGTIKARIRSGLIQLRDAFQNPVTEDENDPLDLRTGEYGSCAAIVS